jgi:hypothetical protein
LTIVPGGPTSRVIGRRPINGGFLRPGPGQADLRDADKLTLPSKSLRDLRHICHCQPPPASSDIAA